MSFEDILKKIEQEAQQKKKSILDNAQLEANHKIEKARKHIELEIEKLQQQKINNTQLIIQRKLAEAKLSGRNLIGKVKADAWSTLQNQLFEEFLKKLDLSYEYWFKKTILSHSVTKKEEVWVASSDSSKIGENFIANLNKETQSSFRYGGVTNEIERGLLLKNNGMIVNLSLKSLLDDILQKYESKIYQMLFYGVEK